MHESGVSTHRPAAPLPACPEPPWPAEGPPAPPGPPTPAPPACSPAAPPEGSPPPAPPVPPAGPSWLMMVSPLLTQAARAATSKKRGKPERGRIFSWCHAVTRGSNAAGPLESDPVSRQRTPPYAVPACCPRLRESTPRSAAGANPHPRGVLPCTEALNLVAIRFLQASLIESFRPTPQALASSSKHSTKKRSQFTHNPTAEQASSVCLRS